MPASESDDAGVGTQQQVTPDLGLEREIARILLLRWAHASPFDESTQRTVFAQRARVKRRDIAIASFAFIG
jgi:hypothetical protein